MQQDKSRIVKISLTEEQRRQIQREVGQEAEALELTVEELEERIAPDRYNR